MAHPTPIRGTQYDGAFRLIEQLDRALAVLIDVDCPSPVIEQVLGATRISLGAARQVLIAAESAEQYYMLV